VRGSPLTLLPPAAAHSAPAPTPRRRRPSTAARRRRPSATAARSALRRSQRRRLAEFLYGALVVSSVLAAFFHPSFFSTGVLQYTTYTHT
jgi:hypothetical protein